MFAPEQLRFSSGPVSIAAGLLLALALAACKTPCVSIDGLDFTRPAVGLYESKLPTDNRGFAVLGDTQRTSLQECLIGREVNDAATAQIIRSIATEKPAFAVIVGDLVFHGADADHWAYFDHIAAPLRQAEVPILPAAGNHEYWGSNRSALQNMRARFDRFRTDTWYADRYAGIGLVVIDTNADEIGDEAWQRQKTWYEKVLADMDQDASIRGVVVFGHHPPFTNSTMVAGDAHVQQTFVPSFCNRRKALAFVTGHAHGYEHFVRGPSNGCGISERHFIVTAGGGGPRPDSLRDEKESGWDDQYQGSAPRPFNYLWVEAKPDALHIQVRGFDKGESSLRDLETFQVPYADQKP